MILGKKQTTLHSHFSSFNWAPSHNTLDHLNSIGINTLQDITIFNPHTRQYDWILTPTLWPHGSPPVRCLSPLRFSFTPPRLTSRQCWLLGTDSWVTEIIGFTTHSPPRLCISRWKPCSLRTHSTPRLSQQPVIRLHDTLSLDPATHSYGAGTPLQVPYHRLFPPGITTTRVILSAAFPLSRRPGVYCSVLHLHRIRLRLHRILCHSHRHRHLHHLLATKSVINRS